MRDRAFLAVLLFVGAAAIASGLYQLMWLNSSMPTGIFDAVLGLTVLLVTWLFLAPYVLPETFGLPTAASVRPASTTGPTAGRPPPLTAHRPEPRAPAPRAPAPAPAGIPRWADPLVDRSGTPAIAARPGAAAAAPTPPAPVRPRAPPSAPSPNALEENVPEWLETDDKSSTSPGPASQIIDELDQITTQLGPEYALRSSRRLSPST